MISEKHIVYYDADKKPEIVWKYVHNPDAENTYDIKGNLIKEVTGHIEQVGYWLEDKEEKVSRHFVRSEKRTPILMTYDEFMENKHFVPDPASVQTFASEEEFLLELL